MKGKDFAAYMNRLAPLSVSDAFVHATEGYDNSGFLVGDLEKEVTGVLCCLDVTMNVLKEAVSLGCNLVLSHHPFIYGKMGSVTSEDRKGRELLFAIENGISIYSAHLSLDFTEGGLDAFLADAVGGTVKGFVTDLDGTHGCGRIVDFDPVSFSELVQRMVTAFSEPAVRIVGEERIVKRAVTFVGGGGDEEAVESAIHHGADVLISGDFKHHVLLEARECGINVISLGHGSMEGVAMERITMRITEELPELKVLFSREDSRIYRGFEAE